MAVVCMDGAPLMWAALQKQTILMTSPATVRVPAAPSSPFVVRSHARGPKRNPAPDFAAGDPTQVGNYSHSFVETASHGVTEIQSCEPRPDTENHPRVAGYISDSWVLFFGSSSMKIISGSCFPTVAVTVHCVYI